MGQLASADREDKLQCLRPHHRAMARAMASGATCTDLAKRFGVSPAWVSQIVNSALFQAELSRLESSIEDAVVESELRQLQPRAVEVIAEELFTDVPSARRTKTAFDLLDRTGYHPRNEANKQDNRKYTFISFAPMPGEDPQEHMKRIQDAIKSLPEEEEPLDAEFSIKEELK